MSILEGFTQGVSAHTISPQDLEALSGPALTLALAEALDLAIALDIQGARMTTLERFNALSLVLQARKATPSA